MAGLTIVLFLPWHGTSAWGPRGQFMYFVAWKSSQKCYGKWL